MSLTSLPFPVDPVPTPAIEVLPETYRNISSALAKNIQEVLEQKVKAHPELENILIATADGFDIAAMIKDSDKDRIRRLAAISSSMLSLSVEILSEMSAGEHKTLILEGEAGNIFITQIAAKTFGLSLTVITRDNESLGKFFWLISQLKGEVESVCAQALQDAAKSGEPDE